MKPKVQAAVNHVITNFPELWQSNYQPLLVLLTEHCGIKMADEVVSRVLRPRNEGGASKTDMCDHHIHN